MPLHAARSENCSTHVQRPCSLEAAPKLPLCLEDDDASGKLRRDRGVERHSRFDTLLRKPLAWVRLSLHVSYLKETLSTCREGEVACSSSSRQQKSNITPQK